MPAQGWKTPGTEGKAKQEVAKLLGDKSDAAQNGLLFFENKNGICSIMVVDGEQGSIIGISVLTTSALKSAEQED